MKVENGTFVVTGGVSGLGEHTARFLLQKGANIVLFDRNTKRGHEIVAELDSKYATNSQ